jgi:hypothetical protein
LDLILLTRLFVSLFCYKEIVSIQEYLKIVNGKYINNIKSLNFYKNNLDILQEKLTLIFMDPDILIVSKKIFYIITYTKNIYKYTFTDTYSKPFINKQISLYTQTILNDYLFSSILSTINNTFNNNVNDYNLQLTQLIYTINFFSKTYYSIVNLTAKQIRQNYLSNNFLFDFTIDVNKFLDENLKKVSNLYLPSCQTQILTRI